MTENLLQVQKDVDLGKPELVQLANNAFESAWLPRATRDRYLSELGSHSR
jgi:adenosine deaminase